MNIQKIKIMYSNWHQLWIHGPAHWMIFACAIIVFTSLFAYCINTSADQNNWVVSDAVAQVSTR
ncbi:MAG: hypothetical protein WCT08_00205 [Patescibacteria group bacterium]